MGTWSDDQRLRLALEEELIAARLPGFTFHDHARFGMTTVRGTYVSSAGTSYSLCLWLTEGFPHEMPKLYVLSPSPLLDYWGAPIVAAGTSHSMHVWQTDWGDYVKICHWKSDYWSASQTVVSVVMKGILWIEAYEVHKRTGESIDDFSIRWESLA